jgi:hypothetical protein
LRPRSNSSIFMRSMLMALCKNQELSDYFLSKHKINIQDEWISTSNMIDCLWHIEEKVGSHTLQRIGVNIAQVAPMSISAEASFNDFLIHQLNDTYKNNHQSLSGGFTVSVFEDKFLLDLNNNPYPLTFNKGLITGFSFKHRALNNIYEVDKDMLVVEKVI